MAILLPDRVDVASFGAFLRDARERRGLTLQQIASETRIPWRHLEALEHGNLEAVPSGMYRRAEIRAYADAVGLDRNLALAQLDHALESSAADRTSPRQVPATETRTHMAWVAVGSIGVIAAATMFMVSLQTRSPQPAAAGQPVGAVIPPAGVTASSQPQPDTVPTPVAHETTPQALAEATTRPAVAPVVDVTLTITSDPGGARVVVDGIGRGSTPLAVPHLSAGARRIRVIKDGYVSQERVVRVGEGTQPTALHVTLDAVQ